MGSKLTRRLLALKEQTEKDVRGRVGFLKTFVIVVSGMGIFCTLASEPNNVSPRNQDADKDASGERREKLSSLPDAPASIHSNNLEQPPESEQNQERSARLAQTAHLSKPTDDIAGFAGPSKDNETTVWVKNLEAQVLERKRWIEELPFGTDLAECYRRFAQSVVFTLMGPVSDSNLQEETAGQDDLFSFEPVKDTIARATTGALLRLGFITIAFWPFWLFSSVFGVLFFYLRARRASVNDLLGIAIRGTSPFYSGIYGPLSPNHSMSGIDYSVPSLACPAMQGKQVTMKHQLIEVLRKYQAFNETNLDLARIILAYAHFPSFVEEERPVDENNDQFSSTKGKEVPALPVPILNTVVKEKRQTNEKTENVERSSLNGLNAVLQAHQILTRYYLPYHRLHQEQALHPQPSSASLEELLEDRFAVQKKELAHLAKDSPPFTRSLLLSLTPRRGEALSRLSPSALASACLAIEAGKALVFQEVHGAFRQISRFPHLQARSVLQSVPGYHREYNGDTRLIIRQAILCSRRHGDFGRAFLPVNMPTESRALRDWLEIMYAPEKKQGDIAHLVELDGHIEEIHDHWRKAFTNRIKGEEKPDTLPYQGPIKPGQSVKFSLWKGVVYKSVVLVPLKDVIEFSLSGVNEQRRRRMFELITITRNLQASVSISARLPGFKRQAVEAEESNLFSGGLARLLLKTETGAKLVEDWLVIRRMLTRYNWLSTRVGDDAVPIGGLVQGMLNYCLHDGSAQVASFDALVPLRQRRYKELLGPNWERTYYYDSPHPNDVTIFVNPEDFEKRLGVRLAEQEANSPPPGEERKFPGPSVQHL